MCGISGIVAERPVTEKQREMVENLNHLLVHRGPDGEGFFHSSHSMMAMRRLSIIDLDGGWQPLFNQDRSLAVMCNGEIYNYPELRADLEKRGYQYQTESDVENILYLYEEYGLDFVHHLRGMFAISLWDEKRERLILVRDRIGEKPLYLYENGHELFYASEIKAFLKSGLVPLELDPIAIDHYFHYNYVPEPRTPVRGIRKLPAGHMLVIETSPWQMTESKYWGWMDAPPLDQDPISTIRDELEHVSELVVRSDVPVGVALSGGIDSSVVAAMAVNKYPGTIHAFSVGYTNSPETDERADARKFAEYLDIPFHEIQLEQAEMVEQFPALVGLRDDPIADFSGFGYYMVQKLSREHNVPVMLQGQGGDELFWGYDWVRKAALETLAKAESDKPEFKTLVESLQVIWPTGLDRKGLGPSVRALGGIIPSWEKFKRRTLGNKDQMIFYDLAREFSDARGITRSLFQHSFQEVITGHSPMDIFQVDRPWEYPTVEITRLIAETYLLENGIAQGDRLGMASSIELRLPLLDYRLVETVIGLRKHTSDHALPPKFWLKEAVKYMVPDWVLNRPKRGFEPPVREWHAALFEQYGHLLVNGLLVEKGVLTHNAAQRFSHGEFPKHINLPLAFKALVLEMWVRAMSQ